MKNQRAGTTVRARAAEKGANDVFVKRVLFSGAFSWWHEFQSFEHGNARWCSDALAMAPGQHVMGLEAKYLLFERWVSL